MYEQEGRIGQLAPNEAKQPDGVKPGVGPAPPSSMLGAGTRSVPVLQPSASYSITTRVRLQQRPGAFAAVAAAIGETGAILGAIDLVRVDHGEVVRDITVACVDAAHGEAVAPLSEVLKASSWSGYRIAPS